MFEPIWNSNHVESVSDHHGGGASVSTDRGRFYEPVGALRDVVVNHLMQVVAAAAMEPPAGGTRGDSRTRSRRCFRAMPAADPTHYVRGQYDGYRGRGRCLPEFHHRDVRSACGWTSRTGAGPACRSSSAPARAFRSHRPRSAWCSSTPRSSDSPWPRARPEPNQLVIRLDPSTGVRMRPRRAASGCQPTRPRSSST